jgi:hypothetical protein
MGCILLLLPKTENDSEDGLLRYSGCDSEVLRLGTAAFLWQCQRARRRTAWFAV